MTFKRLFKDKYADNSPENASVVQTLFGLFEKCTETEAPFEVRFYKILDYN